MTFVCTAADQHPPFRIYLDGNSYAIQFPVGHDDDQGVTYFGVVGLGSARPGDLQYYFHIVELEYEYECPQQIWSGKDLPQSICACSRSEILEAIVVATAYLLDEIRPDWVFRTVDGSLPPKALEKHSMITKVFIDCGYRVHTADRYQGRRIWWMERCIGSDRF
jgi:hypothetical protein